MASIQINQLRPIEAPMGDLSYDMSETIRGGSLSVEELGGINSRMAIELLILDIGVLQATANFWKGASLEFQDNNDFYNNYDLS